MNYLDKLSAERKQLQAEDLLPEWFSTAGYQLFKQKYLWADTPRQQYETIAATLAAHTDDAPRWKHEFFNLLWKGWLSPSTPILANTGTTRGLPVSCSGGYIADSIDGFYSARRETALLTKYGFGTSGYLGDVRARGTPISSGGQASGSVPVIKGFVQDSRDVSQGGVRRGSFASYLPIDHGDFYELVNLLETEDDDLNVGWTVSDKFVEQMNNNEGDARKRFAASLKAKLITGKGYYWFTDKANRKLPKYYPIPNKASNLCSEINLPSDSEHTFTCVLSSMNVAKYDEWKDTNAIFTATVFLDCVASEFIARAKGIPGLENAVRFTEKARALGLGVAGFHTYLQSKRWSFGSLEAVYFNQELFEKLDKESLKASLWMGDVWGFPEWVMLWADGQFSSNGYPTPAFERGLPRNCSRLAVAPTKSTALIMGGISEGINPDVGFVYSQSTAGGEVERVSPVLLDIMKERGVYNKKSIQEISDAFGSVQDVGWLSDEEKVVFRTAFEIDQHAIIRLAAQRGRWLDQWQSLNLFFSADADPAYVRDVHLEAFNNPAILGLYYLYSKAGVKSSQNTGCEVCE